MPASDLFSVFVAALPSACGGQVFDLPGRVDAAVWAAPKLAGIARKEMGSFAPGKAQPFHTSGGRAANTPSSYQALIKTIAEFRRNDRETNG
jgi:hypothetical protein